MLKQFCQNQDISEIDIEEKYKTWVANLRTDRYVTVMSLLKYDLQCFDLVAFIDHMKYSSASSYNCPRCPRSPCFSWRKSTEKAVTQKPLSGN